MDILMDISEMKHHKAIREHPTNENNGDFFSMLLKITKATTNEHNLFHLRFYIV